MFRWMFKLLCRLAHHPGVYREWEWCGAAPQWRERTDAWTCIRCGDEFIAPPHRSELYRVPRPQLGRDVIEIINSLTDIDQIQPERIRVRAGDPTHRERIETDLRNS